jgi:hypothetical protein
LAKIAATEDFRAQMAAKSPDLPSATIALSKPLTTLKVPPAAIFALTENLGCLQSGHQTYPVTVVGSGLGASLVTTAASTPMTVSLGSAITATKCR